MEERPATAVDRVEISGTLQRHAVEALQLEIRRLARRYGVDIQAIRVERVEGQDVSREKRRRSA